MQKYLVLTGTILLFSCSKKTETIKTPSVLKETVYIEKPLETQIVKEEIIPKNDDAEEENTGNSVDVQTSNEKSLAGKHSLTLQWISWDKPGTITFKPIGKNLYKVSGSQIIGKQYLKIDGEISQVSDKELSFDGTMRHSTIVNGNGKECVKKGPQTFLSTQNRKYWRMQEMQNCDGIGTDYIDIYF